MSEVERSARKLIFAFLVISVTVTCVLFLPSVPHSKHAVYGFLCFYICALATIIRHRDLICTEAAASIVALGLLRQAVAASFEYRAHKKGSEFSSNCDYSDYCLLVCVAM